MSDLISRLSELRSQYSCFDESERDAYHTLSDAIEALQAQATLDDVSNAYENGYQQGKFEALQQREAIKTAIEALSTDIVRCKDCKHMIINKNHEAKPMICCLTKMCGTTDADWFCADGERKEQ